MKPQPRKLKCPLCGYETTLMAPSARMWHGACGKRDSNKEPPEMLEVKA